MACLFHKQQEALVKSSVYISRSFSVGLYAVSCFIHRYHKYPVQLINSSQRLAWNGGARGSNGCQNVTAGDFHLVLGQLRTHAYVCTIHMFVYGTKTYGMVVGLHLPDPNPHLLTCSAEPFNKTRIIAWHYFNHIPSVEYLADDKHAPGSPLGAQHPSSYPHIFSA